MPLPFIIGAIAVAAGAAGIGSGIHGGDKMKEAQNTTEAARWRNGQNNKKVKSDNRERE